MFVFEKRSLSTYCSKENRATLIYVELTCPFKMETFEYQENNRKGRKDTKYFNNQILKCNKNNTKSKPRIFKKVRKSTVTYAAEKVAVKT